LNDLTGDPRPQPEEVILESFDRNHDEVRQHPASMVTSKPAIGGR
jgi:hypothetical protein